ncbi:Ankyrin repeat and BTB/POZ domain-containing protein 1 [Elasticomyces elasticus]|nr:Ankyrin repeat and BTB/POZ domain-containing protein 1 [Elasticomyces elasticus]
MADEEPPRKRAKYDLSHNFRIHVGKKGREFTVPEAVVKDRSRFFKEKASTLPRDVSEIIKLPGTELEVFNEYLKYLYFGSLDVKNPEVDTDFEATRVWVDVYSLAEELWDPSTMNIVMDQFVRGICDQRISVDIHTIAHVYDSTDEGSKLRKLFVDYYIHDKELETDDEEYMSAGAGYGLEDFGLDMLREMKRLKKTNMDKKVREAFDVKLSSRGKCRYHRHDEFCPPCAPD